jgi:hypothetical protein
VVAVVVAVAISPRSSAPLSATACLRRATPTPATLPPARSTAAAATTIAAAAVARMLALYWLEATPAAVIPRVSTTTPQSPFGPFLCRTSNWSPRCGEQEGLPYLLPQSLAHSFPPSLTSRTCTCTHLHAHMRTHAHTQPTHTRTHACTHCPALV